MLHPKTLFVALIKHTLPAPHQRSKALIEAGTIEHHLTFATPSTSSTKPSVIQVRQHPSTLSSFLQDRLFPAILPIFATTTMCTTLFSSCNNCHARWVHLRTPCKAGGQERNLLTCPRFTQQTVRPFNALATSKWRRRCPKCDGKGEYNAEKERCVEGTTYGVRFGTGPARGRTGVEVLCCVVM